MIAIDWGTTSLRAFRLDAAGSIVDQRRSALGILACEGRFESVLAGQIADWDDSTVVLAGMIGSRQGWVEAPYVECPAAATDLAGNMLRVESDALPEREIWIVPGLSHTTAPHAAEVMRGEEVQICGLLDCLDRGRHTLCLPGTHSKWVIVDGQRIEALFTAMTGEVFHLLREHSLLGRMMSRDAPHDPAAFKEGIARAQQPGGLLHHLFSVRTRGLLGTLRPEQSSSYLSGLLIGHEVLHTQARMTRVHLIGSPVLVQSYSLALQELGIEVQAYGEALAARGIYLLACCRGLIESGVRTR